MCNKGCHTEIPENYMHSQIFLVISATICFADEDGQYEPDNSGLYQPGAYGDDGSYIPDYSGRYIPDYSGLYHSDGTGFYSPDRSGDYANKNNFGSSSNVILKSILFAPKKIQPSTNNLVKIDEKKIKQIREVGRASHYYKY